MNDVKDFFWPFSILWLCVLLGLIACTACKYDSACCYRYIVVCLSVSLCVTNVSPIKTAEPIEIPFGYVLGGPKEPCSWGLGSPRETGNLVYVACDATFCLNSLTFVKFVDYLLAHKQFHANVYEII